MKPISLVLGGLIWLLATPGRGEEIANSTQAEELCRTAEPVWEVPDRSTQDTSDPLLDAIRRHDYAFSRNLRLLGVYQVTLDTQAYRFLPSQPDLLTVDTLEPFPLFSGTFELDLGPGLDLTFAVGEETADDIRTEYLTDQVLLELEFQLVSLDDPSRPYCTVTAPGVSRLSGRLLTANLITRPDRQVLATYESTRNLDRIIRLGMSTDGHHVTPKPSVMISNIAFPVSPPSPEEVQLLRLEAEMRAIPCYVTGLNLNGRLQGAVVISSRIDSGGALADPAVTIDALNQPLLLGCVLQALGEITLPRTHPQTPYEVRINFIFRLE